MFLLLFVVHPPLEHVIVRRDILCAVALRLIIMSSSDRSSISAVTVCSMPFRFFFILVQIRRELFFVEREVRRKVSARGGDVRGGI